MNNLLDSSSNEEQPDSTLSTYQQMMPGAASGEGADRPTWTFRDTMVGILLTLVPWLALASLSLFSASPQPTTSQPLLPAEDIINAVLIFILQALLEGIFLIAPLWYAVFKPRRLARQRGAQPPALRQGLRALGMRSFQLWQALGAVVLGMVIIYAASILYSLIAQALHITIRTNVDEIQAQAAGRPWTTLAILLGAVIVAPFCEEIFFRGFFFQGLRLRVALWIAVVLSAVIFGVAHGDLGSLPLLIVIGILLAILRWRTRSLWPGMALHMLNNFLGALVIFQTLQFH
jgi:membrane protease YdiL (CAAX protease family)